MCQSSDGLRNLATMCKIASLSDTLSGLSSKSSEILRFHQKAYSGLRECLEEPEPLNITSESQSTFAEIEPLRH